LSYAWLSEPAFVSNPMLQAPCDPGFEVTVVPEPASLGSVVVDLGILARIRKRTAALAAANRPADPGDPAAFRTIDCEIGGALFHRFLRRLRSVPGIARRTAVRSTVLAISGSFCLALFDSGEAAGFTVDDRYHVYQDGVLDVAATLATAPRWNARAGATRGLAQGIQVAIQPGFLEALAPGPGQEDKVREVLLAAFAAWESPVIAFEIRWNQPVLVGPARGSELDVFAVTSDDPRLAGSGLYGLTLFEVAHTADRTLTNGERLPGDAIVGADLIIAADRILRATKPLSPDQQLAVMKRLLMHEIGHVFGLDHPNQFPDANLLSLPAAPDGRGAVPPSSPTGFTQSSKVNTDAIMSTAPTFPGALLDSLQPDDIAGRNALYPIERGPGRNPAPASSATQR